MKVAEGILVKIRISSPCISRHPALLWSVIDSVVMRSLGLLFPVMDVFVVTRVSPFRFLIRPGILRWSFCEPLFLRYDVRLFFDGYVVCVLMERVLNRTRLIQGYPLSELWLVPERFTSVSTATLSLIPPTLAMTILNHFMKSRTCSRDRHQRFLGLWT